MKLTRRRFAVVLSFTAAACCATIAAVAEPKSSPPKTVRLLTVGNSFSRNAMKYLQDIVEAGGDELILQEAIIGGSSFDKHLERVRIHEADPTDKAGLYASGKSLKDYLRAEPWDVITIQQVSIKSHDAATYRPGARQLYDFIKQHAPQAEVVLHETWAYRVDDPRFSTEDTEADEPRTQRAMYEGLSHAYDEIAEELGGLRVVPVGDAFFAADTDPKWGYKPDTKFDFADARPRKRPDQTHSLHVGWYWSTKDSPTKLRIDGHHASPAGEYLAGCVFYEFLFGANVVGNSFRPETVEADYARFLQETAHAAMARRREAAAATK